MHALTIYNKSRFALPQFGKAFCSQSEASLRTRLKAIEKERLSDPNEELARLMANPSIRIRLENVLSVYKVYGPKFGLIPTLLHKVSFCRSIEVLKSVSDTHFVFNHGQSSSCLLSLSILNYELQSLTSPNQLLDFETKLRHPINFADESLSSETDSVEWFKTTLGVKDRRDYRITDNGLKNSLIACDAYFGSTSQAESAWSYVLANGYKDHEIKWEIINHMAEKLISDSEKRKSFLHKFTEVDEVISSSRNYNGTIDSYFRFGNLYSIIIPKKDFDAVGYLSLPLGFPANLTQSSQIHLDELQNDETAAIPDYYEKPHLQVRLVAKKNCSLNLTTLVFPTRLDLELKADIEQIRALAKEYFPVRS